MYEPFTPELLREMTGLSELPRPLQPGSLPESVDRHYPAELRARGVGAHVLLDAWIDAAGRVVDARVVEPVIRDVRHRAVLVSRDAATGAETQRTLDGGGACDPAFGAAAEAALREVRFTPAKRDGQAVPFQMRLTVVFTP
jgi:hypothetical protein